MAETLRRKPTQDRSKRRLERILDAATHVLAEVGYEAATTEGIAERAGVSIGSIYRFFPNKRALFSAVWLRYTQEIRTLFDAFFDDERLESLGWEQLLDEAVDAFWLLQRSSVGHRAVMKSLLTVPELIGAGDALNRELASRLEKVLVRYFSLEKKRRALVATVIVETFSAMLLVGSRTEDKRALGLLAETKVLLRRYLAPYADKRR